MNSFLTIVGGVALVSLLFLGLAGLAQGLDDWADNRRTAPCSEFGQLSIQSIPARCLPGYDTGAI